MAQKQTPGCSQNVHNPARVTVALNNNQSESNCAKLNIRLSQLYISNLRLAFSIPSDVYFYLKDSNDNVEFADLNNGLFDAEPNNAYYIQFPSEQHTPKKNIECKEENKYDVDDNKVDWNTTKLLHLSGGEGGQSGSKTYTAPNGTVVQSSGAVWKNSNYYYIGYLFNGDVKGTTHTSYWLSEGGANETLTFTFTDTTYVSHIMVCATCNGNNPGNRSSNYSVDGYGLDNKWIQICGLVNTSNDKLGDTRCHMVRKAFSKIRFNVKKAKNNICLKEIDIYVAS
eukprot:289910_1